MAKKKAKKKVQRQSLQPLREQLALLTNEANARVAALSNKGIQSRAVQEAIRTQAPSRRNDEGVLFEANLPRKRDLARELARVQAFLSDYTSTEQGAYAYTSEVESGLFGGQWRQNGGPGYDTDKVSKETGERVFDLYHRTLEAGGGWERVIGFFRAHNIGKAQFGSENLINAIYDMVENQGMSDESILMRTQDIIESMKEGYEKMAQIERAGLDYGIIDDSGYFDRINYWKWRVAREGYKNG